jgi:two-component system sensor histidine kinase KdpD
MIKDEVIFREQETLIENFVNQIGSAVERELLNQKANNALIYEESEKLYKTLFDSISHELKTPIAAIMGASSFLLGLNSENKIETRKQLYEEIHTATIRLNRLVENLLDMARLESGKLVPNIALCDVQDLVNAALAHFGKEIKENSITVDIPENMPFIKADFVLMEQVFKNLIQNALLYTPVDSKIEIQSSFDENSAYIIISDNGEGIPLKDIDHIFNKFYRADSKVSGGTGLGLSIAKGIVGAHKGTITASNKLTGGSKFVIKLPLI